MASENKCHRCNQLIDLVKKMKKDNIKYEKKLEEILSMYSYDNEDPYEFTNVTVLGNGGDDINKVVNSLGDEFILMDSDFDDILQPKERKLIENQNRLYNYDNTVSSITNTTNIWGIAASVCGFFSGFL